MKTIGIMGGMTWESTVTYYTEINRYISKALGDLHSAHCIVYSVDFQDVVETHKSGDWDRAAAILTEVALRLKAAGADFLAMATNTMHIVAPQVRAAAGMPFVHIAEMTADRLIRDGIDKVGLLGTKFTMEMDFYKDVLKERGIAVLIPDAPAREEIHRVINEELALGDFNAASRKRYCAEIDKFAAQGAKGVILGCTEIGLLVQQQHSSLPVYDTALIHAEEIAKFALAE